MEHNLTEKYLIYMMDAISIVYFAGSIYSLVLLPFTDRT